MGFISMDISFYLKKIGMYIQISFPYFPLPYISEQSKMIQAHVEIVTDCPCIFLAVLTF